jgi:hypothetical protein
MVISIYGLFDRERRCRYVGASHNPKKRFYSHSQKGGIGYGIPGLHLVVLCTGTAEEAQTLEPLWITVYKRFGQADLNLTFRTRRTRWTWHETHRGNYQAPARGNY